MQVVIPWEEITGGKLFLGQAFIPAKFVFQVAVRSVAKEPGGLTEWNTLGFSYP